MNEDFKTKLPLIALIFTAVLGIVILFMPWLICDAVGFTGIDFLTHGQDIKDFIIYEEGFDFKMGWQLFVPLIIAILAIVSVIVAALPAFGVQIDSKIGFGIIAVVGLIMLILMIAYGATKGETGINGWEPVVNLAAYGGIGYTLGYVVSLMPLFVGAVGLIETLKKGSN